MSQTRPIHTPPAQPPPPPAPPSRDRAPGRPTPALVSSGGRQRRWSLALLAVLLTVGSGLAFVVLWLNAGDRKPVLAAARHIAVGQEIQRDDIVVVRASVDSGIDPIPASQQDDIVGQIAAVDLVPGTLLLDDTVGNDDGLQPDQTEVAIPIPEEQAPQGLEPGDSVRIYDAPPDSADDQSELGQEDPIADGRVSHVDNFDEVQRISVVVDQSNAGEIVSAIDAERIYLTKITNR